MIYTPIHPDHRPEVEFYKNYFQIQPEQCVSYFYTGQCDTPLDIYVITFNHLFMVEYQIKTLRKFMQTPFHLTIVDNNNWLYPEQSRQVLDLCIAERVTYLKAPDNYYQNKTSFDPTMKLGTTMNWLWLHCIKKRNPGYFGFLDQDCFLVNNLDLRRRLDEKAMYGLVVRNQDAGTWNMHVTPNFYRMNFVQNLPLDFRASYVYKLDTGGANYGILYKDLNPDYYDIECASYRFSDQDVNRKDSVQHYQMIENTWFHMLASSHDQLAGDGLFKLAYTRGFLNARLMI